MPLGTNPTFSQVRAFFGGSASFKDYYRGGPYVPNIPANNAISTTIAGLRLSQFSGADKTVPIPAPLQFTGDTADTSAMGPASVSAAVGIHSNGYVYRYISGSSTPIYQWMPSGQSSSNYRIRYADSSAGANATGWNTIGSPTYIVNAGASGDGFYGDYQEDFRYAQIGDSAGNPLTGWAWFVARAEVFGRY